MAGRKPVTVFWPRATGLGLFAAAILTASAGGGVAHQGIVHKSAAEARGHAAALSNTPGFPNVKGGDFQLVDQFGNVRTSKDPDGRYQLLFFGYANCKAICSVVLPRMAEVVDRLEGEGVIVTPVLITVDPSRDTRTSLAATVEKVHPRMIGLTGSEARLEEAYQAFQIDKKVVFEDPEHGAVYAHGSYIYLLAPSGSFKTLFPPILGPDRIAELVRDYIGGDR
jgi:protein SCO1